MHRAFAACAAVVLALIGLGAPAARALDLETALADVARANPTLAARRARIEAAGHRVTSAGAWESPMVGLGAVNVPVGGGFDTDMMTMKMVEVSQRVPLFGARGLARRAAREAVEVEASSAEATHYELMAAAWSAYADAYFAGELVRQAESHRGIMDRLVRSARARYEATTGRLDEVLRAEAERARIMADRVSFAAEALAARARLDALRGVAPGSDEPLAELPRLADSVLAEPLGVPGVEHPRLLALAAEAAARRASAAAVRRSTWPDLELRGTYGLREPLEGGREQDDMFGVMAGLSLPIFAASRQGAEAAELEAMAREAQAEGRAAELELRERAAGLDAAIAAGVRTIHLLADTVVVTQQRAVDASWSAYSAGTTDLWRVFEASHGLYGEEVALIRARQSLARDQARRLALMAHGEGWGVRVPAYERSRR
jgi:outer membrane protein TolC